MHKEYKRIAAHSRKAVLFIHGIVGTPNHFNTFVTMVPEYISVYNILLDGHGKGVREFSETSMRKWEEQVARTLDELSQTHEEIYIMAHSMGCLLAAEQAVKNTKISGLFLLAVPLKLFIKPKMVLNSLKVSYGRIKPDDKEALAAVACCGVTTRKNPFSYFGWIPRFIELFQKIRATRKCFMELQVPCIAFQSKKDEMVSFGSCRMLRENPAICVEELANSSHFYYDESDFALLKEAFNRWISQ